MTIAVVRGLEDIPGHDRPISHRGEAASGAEVLEKLRAASFSVLLMDVTMPLPIRSSSIRASKAQHPKVAVLVHSMHAGPVASRMAEGGASGYIHQGQRAQHLLAALRKVAAGGR